MRKFSKFIQNIRRYGNNNCKLYSNIIYIQDRINVFVISYYLFFYWLSAYDCVCVWYMYMCEINQIRFLQSYIPMVKTLWKQLTKIRSSLTTDGVFQFGISQGGVRAHPADIITDITDIICHLRSWLAAAPV